MDQNSRDIINIVKSGINGTKLPVSSDFDVKKSLDLVYRHKITNIFYNGLINCGVQFDKDIKDFCLKSLFYELSSDSLQQNIISEITELFSLNEIDHMLLKGSVLKKLYPKAEMRRMGDIDILIKQNQYKAVRKILFDNGYSELGETDHEYKWTKSNVLIELHKRLVARSHGDLYSYYGDWYEKAVPQKRHSYKMTDEDFFIFLFVHFAKHYRKTGIGIIHMCDLYIFLKNKILNEAYLISELEKLELSEFYKNIKATINVWFEDDMSNEMTDYITSVIFASGVYGTHSNLILSQALKKQNKYKNPFIRKAVHVINILFPPYSGLKNRYKVLSKAPFLLPVFWIVRAFDLILFNRERIKNSFDDALATTKDNVNDYKIQLEYVGLNSNFK